MLKKQRGVYLLESSARAYLALNSSRMLKTEFSKNSGEIKKEGKLNGFSLEYSQHSRISFLFGFL